jgi:type IV pilus assembly protein PilM
MLDFFGLDIGNKKIRFAKVYYKNNVPVLEHIYEIANPAGTHAINDPVEEEKLVKAIKDGYEASGIETEYAVTAIPEISVTSRLEIGFPDMKDEELGQAIAFEAKKYISYPIEDMQLDKLVVGEKTIEGEKKLDIFWVATTTQTVEKYVSIAKKAGLETIGIETETLASARLINKYRTEKLNRSPEDTVIMIDHGSNGTDVAVIKGDFVLSSVSLGTGSAALTRIISSSYNITFEQAEEYKKAFGIDRNLGEGKIAATIEPAMKALMDEISRTIVFFQSRLPELTPTEAIFVGEGSRLPGLVTFAKDYLQIDAYVFDSFSAIAIDKDLSKSVPLLSGIGYNVAIGLSLKKP